MARVLSHSRVTPTRRTSGTLLQRLFAFDALFRQRRALATLDRAALEDLGLTHADVAREAKRPVWDAPHHWR
ncbi:DUF1127 domain-containing protein [Pseudaestuariivita sp.]|uniref:DUF1127 domain-containing protein n=1 Tax=Pseudaestuariivita sp. TaxID=2211669 RepID=UPI004058FD3F